jgi:hypothetical protein
MKYWNIITWIPLLIGGLAGCTTIQHFGPLMNSETPDSSSIVSHIQCELYHIVVPDEKIHKPIDNYKLITENRYIAYAQLTLDVTSNEGATPNLNFISPYAKAMTNLTVGASGQFSAIQHKNITQSFTIILDPRDIKQSDINNYCKPDNNSAGGLVGDLGLANVMEAGLYHATKDQFLFPLPSAQDSGVAAAKLGPTYEPVFGSTIDFTITYGLTAAGPTWTITNFKGPGSGNTNLLNATRAVKDTLVISFAPARPEVGQGIKRTKSGRSPSGDLKAAPRVPESLPQPSPIDDAAAIQAAQGNNAHMILQNILPSLPQL